MTDSGSEVVRAPDKPGITNLIDVLAVIRGVAPEQVEAEFDGTGYGNFKQAVADAVVDYLAPARERYQELRPDEAELERDPERGGRKGPCDRLRDGRRGPPANGRRAALLSSR